MDKTGTLAAMGAILIGVGATAVMADEDYPTQSIQVIVPFAAGGGGDFVTRGWSEKVAEILEQPVLVENRSGGATIVGTDVVAQADPDGYTFLVANPNFVTNNFTADPPYDSMDDFEPVGLFTTYPMGLAVNSDLGIETVEDLLAHARENPGALNFGSSGTGSTSHLATLLLMDMAEIEMQHVPYGGAGPAMADVAAGTIDLMFTGLSQSVPHVEAGRARLIGMSSLEVLPNYPDVPPVQDTPDLDGFEALVWWGLAAPAGTPAERIERMRDAVAEAMSDPDVAATYEVLDGDTTVSTPEEFGNFLQSEYERWSRIIEEADLEE